MRPVKNQYFWSTGVKVENYTNWYPNQPISEAKRDNCGAISITNGQWYLDTNCFQSLPYICEIESSATVNPNPSNSKFKIILKN